MGVETSGVNGEETAMNKTVTAVFDGQVLRPEVPLDLELNARYLVTIQDENGAPKSRPPLKGTPGKDLLRFAGTIPAEDVDEMMRAIEEMCERVDPDEW